MFVSRHLSTGSIDLSLRGSEMGEVLLQLAELIAAAEKSIKANALHHDLLQREELLSTAAGLGLAFPHCYQQVKQPVFALGIHQKGLELETPDSQPVRIFLAVISPEDKPEIHLEALSAASRVFLDEATRGRIISAESADDAINIIRAAEQRDS